MKNQQMKHERKLAFTKLFVLMAVLIAVVCCGAVLTSAAEDVQSVAIQGWTTQDGYWCKPYDGTQEVPTVTVTTANGVITVTDATFNSANVGEATFIEVDCGDGLVLQLPAKINPIVLAWTDGVFGTAEITYDANTTQYTGVAVTLPAGALDTTNALSGDVVQVGSDVDLSVDAVSVGTVNTFANVTLTVDGVDTSNYVVAPLPVEVTVNPVAVQNVIWSENNFVFTYGDEGIYQIQAWGDIDGDGEKDIPLHVMVKEEKNGATNFYTLKEAYEKGLYGRVKKADTEGTVYTVWACAPSNLYSVSELVAAKTVRINKLVYQVSLSDAEYLGEADLSNPTAIKPLTYRLLVTGDNVPTSLLNRVIYTYVDASNKTFSNGVSEPGIYTVAAQMPVTGYVLNGESFEDYKFSQTALIATLSIKRNYLVVGTNDEPAQIIIVGSNGISDSVRAEFSVPESLNRKAIHGFHVHKEYTLKISGAQTGEAFTLWIPVSSVFLADKNCDALTVNDLYLYDDAVGAMAPAIDKYTVTLSEDGAYYKVENYDAEGAVTFVMAPVYHAPFWVTAPGIVLIILLVLLILVALFLIGLKLRQIERSGKNPILVIDTEGDVPAVVAVEVEDKIEDADACLAEGIDDLADALRDDIAAEEEALDTDVDAGEAVAEAMDELTKEASAIDLTTPEDEAALAEADAIANTMADELAQNLQETVDAADDGADITDEVNAAVTEAMQENFNESADATDAIVLLAAEEADEISPEIFREAIDAIVADAMLNTMLLSDDVFATEKVAADEEEGEADSNVCAMVADSVAEAFAMVTVDGATPEAVEGLTKQGIADAVNAATETYAPEDWADEIKTEVAIAVTNELAARLLDDDDNDNDGEDDEGSSFAGFGSMPLSYIDAIEEADKYQEMLEQERNGEVQLVTRYRRSFQSRLAQSQGAVQEYYNIIKNTLLSYKGIKNRISWNYESFNLGRTHVAKFNAKTKTLYLYMALNPEELAESKYTFADMSSKKKYASVPVLMKIKGDRKFKHAMEMIAMLCEEKLGLQKKKVIEEVDYKIPYQTTEELVNAGIIKKMVAAIPMEYFQNAEVADEVAVTAAPTEEPNVTAVPAEAAVEVDTAEAVETVADVAVEAEEPANTEE